MNLTLLFRRPRACLFCAKTTRNFSTARTRQNPPKSKNDTRDDLVPRTLSPPNPTGVPTKSWRLFVKKMQDGLNPQSHLKSWAELSQMSRKLSYSDSQSQWGETELRREGHSDKQNTALRRGQIITVVSWNLDCEQGWDPAARASTCLNLLRESEFGRSLIRSARNNHLVLMLQTISSETFRVIKDDPWVRQNFAIAGVPSSPSPSSEIIALRERHHRESNNYRTLMAIPKNLNIARCFRVYRGNQSLQGKGVEYLVVDLPVLSKPNSVSKKEETIRLCTSFCELPYKASAKGTVQIFRRHVGDVTQIFHEARGHKTAIGGIASVDIGTAPGLVPAERDGKRVTKEVKSLRQLHHPVHYDIQLGLKKPLDDDDQDGGAANSMDAFIFGKYVTSVKKSERDSEEGRFQMLGGTPRYREDSEEEGREGEEAAAVPVVPDWFVTQPLVDYRSESTRISCARAASLREGMFSTRDQGGVNIRGYTLTARINERVEDPWNLVHNYPGHVSFFRVPE
ncbi:hypothetical protein QBC44DRAFT_355331 [Cladorrhinum sp. PSN332]|nr:hypothetical protein QBC44DRAFT_355331 [Cladorrhinum sp. PSN332]